MGLSLKAMMGHREKRRGFHNSPTQLINDFPPKQDNWPDRPACSGANPRTRHFCASTSGAFSHEIVQINGADPSARRAIGLTHTALIRYCIFYILCTYRVDCDCELSAMSANNALLHTPRECGRRTDPKASGADGLSRIVHFRVPVILSRKMQCLPTNEKVIMEQEARARVVKRTAAAAFLPLYTDKNLHMTFNRSHPKVKDGMGCGLSSV